MVPPAFHERGHFYFAQTGHYHFAPTGPINALTGLPLRASIGGVAPDLKSAYSENQFFGVQYALSPNWIVEADYLGNLEIHLYTSINRNRFAGDHQMNGGRVTRLNPFFRSMNYTDNSGWSSYHGAVFTLRKTPSHGYYYQVNYTLGRTMSLSDAPGPGRDNSVVGDQADAYNLGLGRSVSSFDIPQNLSFNFFWEIPGPHFDNRWLRGLAHGWELTGLGTMESGYPKTITSGGGGINFDYNGDESRPDYPNLVTPGAPRSFRRSDYLGHAVGVNADGSPHIVGAFKTAWFAAPTLGTQGNGGRNSFRGPGYANSNLSIIKNSHIPWFVGKEGAQFQIRAEIYNVLD